MTSLSFNEFESKHLLNSEQVKSGSFYTPEKIVNTVHALIKGYKDHPRAVIFDNATGAGAFIKKEDKVIYKAVEFDSVSGKLLKKKLSKKIYLLKMQCQM